VISPGQIGADWLRQDAVRGGVPSGRHPVRLVLDRGFKLAEHLRKLGAPIDAEEKALREAAARQLPAGASPEAQDNAYFDARWAVRRLALRNPLLDFDAILFV